MSESNWQDLFEQRRGDRAAVPTVPSTDQAAEPPEEPELASPPNPQEYRPWLLQRSRSRPVMFLDLRRFEPRTGGLIGCQMGYPYLSAIDYLGDRMVSLDFGLRQFVIEGTGLDALALWLQQGQVLAIQEYSPRIWPTLPSGPIVRVINQINVQVAPNP